MARAQKFSSQARWLATLAVVVAAGTASTSAVAQDVPWYQPGGEIDEAPEPPPPPPTPDPPSSAVGVELAPIRHVESQPVEGWASIVRLRFNFDTVGFYVGAQNPNARWIAGFDLNPLGGTLLADRPFATKDLAIWWLWPRLGAVVLFDEPVFGYGGYVDLLGTRVTWCGPVCTFVDFRFPTVQLMAAESDFGDDVVLSVGMTMTTGIAF